MKRSHLLALALPFLIAPPAPAGEEEPEPAAGSADAARREEAGEDGAEERAPGRRRGKGGDGEGREDDAARADEERREQEERRIDEIEEALWLEIAAAEEHLESIKLRLRALFGMPADRRIRDREALVRPLPEGSLPPAGRLAPLPPPAPPEERAARREDPIELDPREGSAYAVLLKRQDDIVKRWRKAARGRGAGDAAGGGGKEADPRPRAGKEPPASPGDLRAELGQVLAEILDLRETARERQLRRLRAEIEDLEQALLHRKTKPERQRLVEAKLRDLLEGAER